MTSVVRRRRLKFRTYNLSRLLTEKLTNGSILGPNPPLSEGPTTRKSDREELTCNLRDVDVVIELVDLILVDLLYVVILVVDLVQLYITTHIRSVVLDELVCIAG